MAGDGLIGGASYLAVGVDDGGWGGWVTWRPLGATPNYEIGIALFPEYRGRGLGTGPTPTRPVSVLEHDRASAPERALRSTTLPNNTPSNGRASGRKGIARGLYFAPVRGDSVVIYAVGFAPNTHRNGTPGNPKNRNNHPHRGEEYSYAQPRKANPPGGEKEPDYADNRQTTDLHPVTGTRRRTPGDAWAAQQ